MIDIEQLFFDKFGIEKKCNRETLKFCVGDLDCNTCKSPFYPKITAEKLLEMICILSQSYPLNYEGWSFNTVQDLKETILEDCITTAKRLSLSSAFVNKIQQLFKD